MQTPNLQLSNIVLKQPHFMAEPTASHFNFELEPITHKPKFLSNVQQKIVQRQKQLQMRKKHLENSQKMRKQMLLQKIEAKNQRVELKKRYEKQNIRSPENACFLKVINKLDIENARNSQKSKFQTGEVHKIYTHQSKMPFTSSKGFLRNTGSFESARKANNASNEDPAFKQIKLRDLKLPELNMMQKTHEQEPGKIFVIGQESEAPQKRKLTKVLTQETANPLLKIHDTRYFGIEQRTEDYEKIGKSLMKKICNKYWCYDSLEDDQVYDNFEDMLLDEVA